MFDRIAVGLSAAWLAWALVQACRFVAGGDPGLVLFFLSPSLFLIAVHAVALWAGWAGRPWAPGVLLTMALMGPCFLPFQGTGLPLWGVLAPVGDLYVRAGFSVCFAVYWILRLVGVWGPLTRT